VKKIVTNLAVLEVVNNGFNLLERAPGVSIPLIKESTIGNLIIEDEIPEMKL
jgi:3-oxoacid CoA-transferase subunit B